jgi:hypothetical protein
MPGVHHPLPDYQRQVHQLEEARYRLCMDDDGCMQRCDRQTIEDVQGVRVRTGLERFLSRARKFNKMILNKDG